jgi:hypothetical protein
MMGYAYNMPALAIAIALYLARPTRRAAEITGSYSYQRPERVSITFSRAETA